MCEILGKEKERDFIKCENGVLHLSDLKDEVSLTEKENTGQERMGFCSMPSPTAEPSSAKKDGMFPAPKELTAIHSAVRSANTL